MRTRSTNGGVAITFADTGDGIRPQDLARLFEPMFTTKLRGVGLGLTVVQRTIEQHSGRVEIKSREGRGTEVMITLPLTGKAPEAEAAS
jgi:signal transduction histidine kinase